MALSVDRDEEMGTVLFPLGPKKMDELLESMKISDKPIESRYSDILESQCGATDDSQDVEQYDGTLGITVGFLNAHQSPVGQLQWNSDLASKYANPGNVSGRRWCSGTLISENLFLSAGHCFDQHPPSWRLPLINGTTDVISNEEIARNMRINFNYQFDPRGVLRSEVKYDVVDLVEYRLGSLDFAIVRLAGMPGKRFGTGRVALGDPAVGQMLAIIGHPAGVPKRIEAGPLTALSGNRVRYNDIDTLGGNSGSAIWHSPAGTIVGVHTNGGCQTDGGGSNSGFRISSIREKSATLRQLDNFPIVILPGTYTIKQKSSARFVDAHELSNKDHSVVTRTVQSSDFQAWVFVPVATVYTAEQVSSGRYLDAYEFSNDFNVVTRPNQDDNTQRWVFTAVHGGPSAYRVQQLSSRRFLDAHENSGKDFSVVTRTFQNNDSQRWSVNPLGDDIFTLQQKNTARFMDAHESGTQDFSVVTRPAQNNDTQRWRLKPVGAVYTIQQKSSGRFVDAHENNSNDYSVVTRTNQINDSQRWVLFYEGDSTFTLQQLSSHRFMDAHEVSSKDFSVVTRDAQNNDTQRWVIEKRL